MRLSAPRQILFAFILLVNFVLTAILAIYSLSYNAQQTQKMQGSIILNQLTQDLSATVAAKDPIGLALALQRYVELPQVNSMLVTAIDGEVLSSTGQTLIDTDTSFTGDIFKEKQKIGSITLSLKPIDRGDVVKNQWPLFLGMIFLHMILWWLYRIVAKQVIVLDDNIPRRELDTNTHVLSHDKNKTNLNKSIDTHSKQKSTQSTQKPEENQRQTNQQTNQRQAPVFADDINDPSFSDIEIDDFIDDNRFNDPDDRLDLDGFDGFGLDDTDAMHTISDEQTEPEILHGLDEKLQTHTAEQTTEKQVKNRPTQVVPEHLTNPSNIRLHIQLHDPRNLLPKLSPSILKPYVELCDKLLASAINHLSDSQLIPKGVSFDCSRFSEHGVRIIVISQNAKVAAFSAFLLGRLYLLVHEVTFLRHREINRFALTAKACIAQGNQIDAVAGLLEFDAKENDIMLLLKSELLTLFKKQVQMRAYPNPTSVIQREVAFVEAVSRPIVEVLTQLRDDVLL